MPESRTFTKELAEIHGGIVVTLEHRFYGCKKIIIKIIIINI